MQQVGNIEKTVDIQFVKGVKIRPLRGEDLDIFAEFLESLSPKTEDTFHPHPLDYANAKGITDAQKTTEGMYFIATYFRYGKEWVIGYVYFGVGGVCSLGICVRDGYQGCGLGRNLMEHAVEMAQKDGRKGLTLTVHKRNPPGIHTYEKMGFSIAEEIADGTMYRMDLQFQKV